MWHPTKFMLIKNPRPSMLVQIFLFQAQTFPDKFIWTDFLLSTSEMCFLTWQTRLWTDKSQSDASQPGVTDERHLNLMKILQQDNQVWYKHAAGKDGVFESWFTVAKKEGYKGSWHLFIYILAHTEIFILMGFFFLLVCRLHKIQI